MEDVCAVVTRMDAEEATSSEMAAKEPYLIDDKIGTRVVLECRKKGLIIRPLGNVIVLMPPLSMSPQELKRMLDIVHAAIKRVTEKA